MEVIANFCPGIQLLITAHGFEGGKGRAVTMC